MARVGISIVESVNLNMDVYSKEWISPTFVLLATGLGLGFEENRDREKQSHIVERISFPLLIYQFSHFLDLDLYGYFVSTHFPPLIFILIINLSLRSLLAKPKEIHPSFSSSYPHPSPTLFHLGQAPGPPSLPPNIPITSALTNTDKRPESFSYTTGLTFSQDWPRIELALQDHTVDTIVFDDFSFPPSSDL